jgi:uncharacterized protein
MPGRARSPVGLTRPRNCGKMVASYRIVLLTAEATMFRLACALWLGLCFAPLTPRADDLCPGAVSVREARALSAQTTVTIQGVVTAATDTYTEGQSFALQDETGGIYVYRHDGIGQVLAIGDRVCVAGRLASYHGLIELSPSSTRQVVRLGKDAQPAPKSFASSPDIAGTQGLLVSIAGPVNRLGERRFHVGETEVYIYPTTGIDIGVLSEECSATVTGLSSYYDAPQLWPRSQADIIPGQCKPAPCDTLTIAQIQGPGASSLYDGQTGLDCVEGCVTGVAANGFYLQSPSPDKDPRTSEGIFLYRFDGWSNPRALRPGDRVQVHDFGVQEFYNSTEIVGLENDTDASYRRVGACELPAPIPVSPLIEPAASPDEFYERYEDMRVVMRVDGAVAGPTTRYLSRYPAGDPEIALVDRQSPLLGKRLFGNELPVGRGLVFLSGGLGRDLPDVGTGAEIHADAVAGILAYQFERYVLLLDPDAGPINVKAKPHPVDVLAPVGPDEFAICTFNLENLFDAVDDGDGDMGAWAPASAEEYARQVDKRAVAIRDKLRSCTVIGVQEIEGKDAVWESLAAAVGTGYRYDYYESVDPRDITVGVLYDGRRVSMSRSDQLQACTAQDYGVDYAAARGPRTRANPCGAGSFPLFERPPYLAKLTIGDDDGTRSLDVTILVNHFKSKRGDETDNLPQRVAQARHVAGLMVAPNTVALGDFNDLLESAALAEFGAYVNLYSAHLPPEDRYSYIYNGLAEAVDHVIMTPGLDRYFLAGAPIHINADYPDLRMPDDSPYRSSDHDPLFVRFSYEPTGVSQALAGVLSGMMASQALGR